MQLLVIHGSDITNRQLQQLNESTLREFHTQLSSTENLADRIFFFIVKNGDVLALGNLKIVYPVVFNNEIFSLQNIGGIIANQKGKGYGKQIIVAIRDFLRSHNETGVGFCMPKNKGFYEKCGLTVDMTATKRFEYRSGNERITDQHGQYVIYQDGHDRFMEKVLSHPTCGVSIPTPTMW